MNVTGDIRSSITHYNGKYYFTSKGGYFYEATVDEKGTIEDVRTLKLYNYADDPANPAMSTCTPTIYNGRAYIGISGTLLSITMATSTPVFGWARSTRPTMCA